MMTTPRQPKPAARSRLRKRSYIAASSSVPRSGVEHIDGPFDDCDAGTSEVRGKFALELGEEIARLLAQVGEHTEAGNLALKHGRTHVPFAVDTQPRLQYAFEA